MKKTYFAPAMIALLLTVGCGEKKEEKTVMTFPQEVEQAAPAEPMTDDEWHFEKTDSMNGQTYHITLHRHADNTLPLVKDETGDAYFDNCAELHIQRDGAEFFSKTFTKESFDEFLSDADRNNAMLMGVAYDCVENGKLTFGAQVGQPGTDGGMLFVVSINAKGEMSITKDDGMKTSNPEEI